MSIIAEIMNHPLYQALPQQFTLLFILIGGIFGSFFNVLAMRWPENVWSENDSQTRRWLRLRDVPINEKLLTRVPTSLMGGRSACMSCGKKIPLYLNIPIFSWLMLRGKALCCGSKIKFHYFAYEIFGALVFGAVAYLHGADVYGLVFALTIMILSLIAVIDFTSGFIPEELIWCVVVMSACMTYSGSHNISIEDAVWSFLVVMPAIVLTYWRNIIGVVDVLLCAVISSIIGWEDLLLCFVLAPVLNFVCSLLRAKLEINAKYTSILGKEHVSFGPPIVIAGVSLMFYGLLAQ